MATFSRVVPSSQVSITRRELEQAGATDIRVHSAGDGMVQVTATMPGESWVARASGWFMVGVGRMFP